jgi:hypothetical protein
MIALASDECLDTEEGEEKIVLGEWELLSIFISNIVRFSRRMRWAGNVAHVGDERCLQGFGGETSW